MYILFILFLVSEGFKVKNIDFHGNRSFSDKELRKIIYTSEGELYDEFQVSMDKKQIISFYRNKGFKDTRVIKWSKNIVDFNRRLMRCDIYIEEGVRQYMEAIEFEGNEVFADEKLQGITKLHPGEPLDKERIFVAKCKIADLYANHGYAYAEVEDTIREFQIPEPESQNKVEVIVCFQIKEHSLVRFGNIRVKGHESVRNEIITREIIFKKWDIYSPQKLHLSQARIYGTDLFESVRFELNGIEEKRDTVDVIFLVKERRPKWVAFGGGYSSPNRAWFDMGWGHSNLGNNGQKLSINLKYELNPFCVEDLQKLELNLPYREPYFLNTSFKAEVAPFYKLFIQEKDTAYQLTHIGAQGRIGKYIGRYGQFFLGYNYEVVQKRGKVPEMEGIINSIVFSSSWDTRSDVFYPRMGGIQSFSCEYAGLGGDFRFRKFVVEGSLNSRFFKTVITTRLKFGGIFGDAPIERRFVLGGANTVRGYPDMMYMNVTEERKNWIGLFNLEFRIPIWWKFELAYFIDVGNVWWDKENTSIKEIKAGAGFGIRLRTPIGPVRVDYGHRIVEAEGTKGRVYFGIGYMF